MNTGAPEMYLIPWCSCHRVQRHPSDGFKIGRVVVKESAIEFRIEGVLAFLQTTVRRVGDLHGY